MATKEYTEYAVVVRRGTGSRWYFADSSSNAVRSVVADNVAYCNREFATAGGGTGYVFAVGSTRPDRSIGDVPMPDKMRPNQFAKDWGI